MLLNYKFTDNVNMAYCYEEKRKALRVAELFGAYVIPRIVGNSKCYIIVKEDKYLTANAEF